MRKPQSMTFKRFAARFTEMNNFLQLFPGLDVTKMMTHEELNRILLHAVPNEWGKQSYIKGWDSEMKTYKAATYTYHNYARSLFHRYDSLYIEPLLR